ncbi:MAG: PepSY domain-containing protein [Gammaproteobacteria bacterium]|nr:PepSY domain-containing protein [Gammaproteobacteria bacterium]
MTRHKRHHRIKLRSMYQWHRYVGVSVALFVMVLSVTGFMLNHTEALGLDKQYVKNAALLDWYGIRVPESIQTYKTSFGWVSQWHDTLMVNDRVVNKETAKLLGAVVYRDMLVIALQGKLHLYTPDLQLIETLGGVQGVPSGMWSIGLDDKQGLVVNSAHGSYLADKDLLQWQHTKTRAVKWSAPSTLPENIFIAMQEQYRGRSLSMERFTLDLHSGRLFGQLGVYLVDAAGMMLMFLACSGLWLWSMRLLRARQGQH